MSLLGRSNNDDDLLRAPAASVTGDSDDTATLFDVAIDAYSRRLYYSDTKLDAIMVVDMTADYRLIGAIVRNGDGGAVQRPRHIAVDAENG